MHRNGNDMASDLKSRLHSSFQDLGGGVSPPPGGDFSRASEFHRFYENRCQDVRRRLLNQSPLGRLSPFSMTSFNDLSLTGEKFCVRLDVGHYGPEDIEVKTVDQQVVVRGRHDERADEIGTICREFTRRIQLPKDIQPESVKCSLTSDGYLVIEAPRKPEKPPANERVVPIKVLDTPVNNSASQKINNGHGARCTSPSRHHCTSAASNPIPQMSSSNISQQTTQSNGTTTTTATLRSSTMTKVTAGASDL
ncbi:alpha-crystallin B chain-like isoform X2 [Varroa jacobsoni]|uniref:alpha-crystallin B chain-like isoform X2 n=1 Tax=Varroa jacobsoni TaxID=62625 RepID=UPI000BF99CD8|nr:alpha-crystallin B chain-like isoform X2 [Varroa jacobsoni]XP_022700665.1 alpha-crystallin B chain-like isoform X2 [Varroa jacobsoni]XP_022700666.1 alpha-crystallin B chain-like isoform X2 [Varroa jacobsoni]